MLHRIETPAGCGGAGGRPVGLRPEHQGGHAGFFRGKLQPPAGGEGHVRYFPDNSGDPAAAQPFFHCPEGVCVAPGADQNHAGGIDAELQQGRTVERACIERPGPLTPENCVIFRIVCQTARQQGAERRGNTGIRGENFMQRAPCQPAAGQVTVYCIHPEGQRLLVGPGQRAAKSFKLLDLYLQLFQTGRFADRVTGLMPIWKTGRKIGRNPPVSPFLRGKGAVPGASGEPRHRVFQCYVRTNVLLLFYSRMGASSSRIFRLIWAGQDNFLYHRHPLSSATRIRYKAHPEIGERRWRRTICDLNQPRTRPRYPACAAAFSGWLRMQRFRRPSWR